MENKIKEAFDKYYYGEPEVTVRELEKEVLNIVTFNKIWNADSPKNREVLLDVLENKESYNEPKFGTFRWLSVQAGYCQMKKAIQESDDLKMAIKDLVAMSVREALAKNNCI